MKKVLSCIIAGSMLAACVNLPISAQEQNEDPISSIIDLSGVYNQHGIYSSVENETGSIGNAGAFDYDAFLNDIAWEAPWDDGQTDNTLILDGVRFEMRVIDHGAWENKESCVWWNNGAGSYTNFDVEDNIYSSLDILANAYAGERPYLSVKLNYSDGSIQEETIRVYFVYHNYGETGPVIRAKLTDAAAGDGGYAYIGKYSIPVDSSKTLISVDIANDNYKPEGTELEYNAPVAVYAMTLTQTREVYNETVLSVIEDKINALPADITYENKAQVDEITKLITDAQANGIDVAGELSNYSVYLDVVETVEKLTPVYNIIDMSSVYNQHGIYSKTANDTGSIGGEAAFDYNAFISDGTVAWKSAWTDDQTVNTLTLDGVEFDLKVIDHNSWQNKESCVWWNNAQEDYVNFDVEDGYYTSYEILANAYDLVRPYLSVKLNYEGGTVSEETVQLYYVFHNYGERGPVIRAKLTNATAGDGGYAYIGKYSIPVDPSKKLISIDIASDKYKPEDTQDEYNAHAAIYAMTLVQTKEMADRLIITAIEDAIDSLPMNITYENKAQVDAITEMIEAAEAQGINVAEEAYNYSRYTFAVNRVDGLTPVSMIVDMSGIYNQHGIYSSAENDTGSVGNEVAFDYNYFKNPDNIPWNSAWEDAQIDNTLTLGGVEFDMRVIDHNGWTNSTPDVWWNNAQEDYINFDVDDGYYTSYEILANAYDLVRPYLSIKLNYDDNSTTEEIIQLYFAHHNYAETNNPVIRTKLTNATAGDGGYAYIGKYSIPVDPTKKLVSIDIASDKYKPEETQDEYNAHAAIYAMTLMTTKSMLEEEKDPYTFENASMNYDGGNVTVTGTLTKNADVDYEGVLVIAIEDSNGKVLDIKAVTPSGEETSVSESFAADENCRVYYYIWESFDNMRPVCNKTEIK